MIIRPVYLNEREQFNRLAGHPLQSWEWGEFKEKDGIKVVRLGEFAGQQLVKVIQLTIHPLPKVNYTIGYLPKCGFLDKDLLTAIKRVGQENNCLFVKIEPNLTSGKEFFLENGCRYGKPLFTKYTFQLDLTKSEEELLSGMKPKTRYNVRLAQKNQVTVTEDNSLAAFNEYLRLTFVTTKRQGFYAHDEAYHRLMWEIMYPAGIAHLLKATYQGKTLVAWIVFNFNQVLYYPYGASSREYKEVMASSLMMWEAIRFGKNLGCRVFDLWGSLGPNPSFRDPWFGFHRFKEGYGPKLVEFIGTFDLVLNSSLYKIYNVVDSWRWKFLKIKSLFG